MIRPTGQTGLAPTLFNPKGGLIVVRAAQASPYFFFKLDTFNQSLDTLREPWMNESPAVTCCALLCSLGRSNLPELHVYEERFLHLVPGMMW